MIVATAGHVDHGKTSLVRALTGVDTDRLEEEKRRGMSIELGFAYADLGTAGATPVGFVDVPGHERFVRNMLAGVAAIDFALLVIAADDGPMPQTREHLAILQLLGVSQGAVALTKVDRVDAARRSEVQQEIAALLAPTALADAPIFPLVATTGEGVPALSQHLAAAAKAVARRSSAGNFRLAVDRAFSIAGAGVVVTGAVFSGTARVGDSLVVSPQGTAVRLRGVHAQNRPAEVARAGDRCALNLAGTELRLEDLARGDWIVAERAHAPTQRFDARLRVLASEARPLSHWTPVHLHLGATALTTRVAVLEGRAIAPGATGLAQLVLDTPTDALHGDRFILRDQSATRTLAGGIVLDPAPPVRGRSKPARLRQLAALEQPTPAAALAALLEVEPAGVRLDRFERAWNLTVDEAQALRDAVAFVVVPDGDATLAIDKAEWRSRRDAVIAALTRFHGERADSVGPSESELASRLGQRTLSTLTRAVVRALLDEGVIVRQGLALRLATHRATLSAMDAVLLDEVSGVLRAAGLRPPIVGELARTLDIAQPELLAFLQRTSRLGHLAQVAKNRFFLPETVTALAGVAAAIAGESADGTFDAALYRDRSGIGRNLTIEVLEFLDRTGITRRVGDRRRLSGSGIERNGASSEE